MLFTEEEREKLIHTLIIEHWIHSHCFTVSVTSSGDTQLLQKACYCKEKESNVFTDSKCLLFKYADFIIITLSFKM